MNIYKYLKYRDALKEAIEIKRRLPGKWTLRQLASATRLQASFLTNVLKGRLHFSADQLYALADHLGFSANERRYLLLLLEHERAGLKARRDELREQIEALRRENQKTEKHVSIKPVELSADAMAQYYLDPFVQLAHVHLNLTRFRDHPEELGPALGLSKKHLAGILDVLVRIGYVRIERGSYQVVAKNKHLPREAPLCGPLKSIDQMQRLSISETYSFSATLSGNDETKAELQAAYLAFLKSAEAIVKAAPAQKVFQMNFDLFPWEI